MESMRVAGLVDILINTKSNRTELHHCLHFGTPFFWLDAVGKAGGTLTVDEQNKIVKAKKNDPPAADEVFPNLLIGNKAAAEDIDFLSTKKITHVVNLAAVSSTKFIVRPNKAALRRSKIKLTDLKLRPNQKFDEHFEPSGELIEKSLHVGGRVMVNCWQGASRSATVVLAYLIRYQDMGVEEALRMVKEKRDIRPNNSFLQSLVDYEEMKAKTMRTKG
jgi:protein-tyrosine phosphatase